MYWEKEYSVCICARILVVLFYYRTVLVTFAFMVLVCTFAHFYDALVKVHTHTTIVRTVLFYTQCTCTCTNVHIHSHTCIYYHRVRKNLHVHHTQRALHRKYMYL